MQLFLFICDIVIALSAMPSVHLSGCAPTGGGFFPASVEHSPAETLQLNGPSQQICGRGRAKALPHNFSGHDTRPAFVPPGTGGFWGGFTGCGFGGGGFTGCGFWGGFTTDDPFFLS